MPHHVFYQKQFQAFSPLFPTPRVRGDNGRGEDIEREIFFLDLPPVPFGIPFLIRM